jgi:hypothetical protein
MDDAIYFVDRVYNGLNLEDHLVKTAKDEIDLKREKDALIAIKKFNEINKNQDPIIPMR